MLLQGKNAIVTGANRGIGKAIVDVFAHEGANVWAFARKPNAEFEAELQHVSAQTGVWIKPVYADLSDLQAMKEAVRFVMAEKAPVDILVNNAGTLGPNRLFQMTPIEEMQRVFQVNFFAGMALTQMVSRLMTRQKSGAIVNIASIAGLDGDPAQLEYSASKAAVACATKKLARELGSYNIRVNAVAPGLTDTDMLSVMDSEVEAQTAAKTVLNRRANPKEIANAVAFLASEKASFITAQILRVDGGCL